MNPWEREEREKEHEIRREQQRHWREHLIIELSNLPHRSAQQEEQLKTLILERDFERLAQEQGDMEEDNDTNYGKDNMQEVIRLAQNSNQLSTPVTNMKQVDVKTQIVSQASYSNPASNNESNAQKVSQLMKLNQIFENFYFYCFLSNFLSKCNNNCNYNSNSNKSSVVNNQTLSFNQRVF